MSRQRYPSDVSDDEWAFVAPHLTLMTEEAPQRQHSLREALNGLRCIVRTGMQRRSLLRSIPGAPDPLPRTMRVRAATRS